MMAPRRCPTCHALVTSERCPTCVRTRDRRRGTAAQRGYCSARWRKLRAAKLQIDPLCSVCGVIAEHVDHLQAVDGRDDPRFWLWANLDSKCASCHSRKTIAADGGFRR